MKVRRQFEQDTLRLIVAQAEEFALRYQPLLSQDKAEILLALLAARTSFAARERLLFEKRIFRQHALDDGLLRLRFAAGPWPAPTTLGIAQDLRRDELVTHQAATT